MGLPVDRAFRNPQRPIALVLWSLVLLVSAGVAAIWLNTSPERGVALLLIAVVALFLLVALMCEFIYLPRVERHLQALRRGEYLAHWIYSEDEWSAWRRTSHERWGKSIAETPREAFISYDCVYIHDRYHTWRLAWNFSPLVLELKDGDHGQPDWLEFVITWSSGPHRGSEIVRVPIPESARGQVEALVQALMSSSPPQAPAWRVTILAGQKDKAPRRAVYDACRKHRVPHALATPMANNFNWNGAGTVLVPNAETAERLAAELRGLGLTVEVEEPKTSSSEESRE